jgi:hypothetical protein
MATSTVKKIKAKPIRIESNIPLPKYTKMAVRNDLADDLQKMKVGQSRLIDVDFSKEALNTMRTRIHTIQQKHEITDRRFTVNVDPVEEKKMRVWRVE